MNTESPKFRTHGFAITMVRTCSPSPTVTVHRQFAHRALLSILTCCVAGAPIHSAHAQSLKSAQVTSLNHNTSSPAAPTYTSDTSEQGRFFTASLSSSRVTRLATQDQAIAVAENEATTMPRSESITLDGRTVACQAACCWPLARLLDERASTICAEASRSHHSEQRTGLLQANFLRRMAARQRDVGAATALRAYYSWIANQEQLKLVAAGIELHGEQLATQSALIQRGVAIVDPTELQRKRLELRDNQVQLESNERQLAQALLRLTCCSSDPRSAIVEGLEIRPSALPCDQLVAFALQHRQDYLAYVELCQCLDQQSARSIAELLTPLAGGVGLNLLDLSCIEKICLAARGSEVQSHVARELRAAVQLQRRLIEQTVCEKCQSLALAYERTEIAVELLATWDERIESLQRLGELGDARGQLLASARAEQLQARSTLVSRQLSAKLAEVDLAEAMGELAPRCCRGEPWLFICN